MLELKGVADFPPDFGQVDRSGVEAATQQIRSDQILQFSGVQNNIIFEHITTFHLDDAMIHFQRNQEPCG